MSLAELIVVFTQGLPGTVAGCAERDAKGIKGFGAVADLGGGRGRGCQKVTCRFGVTPQFDRLRVPEPASLVERERDVVVPSFQNPSTSTSTSSRLADEPRAPLLRSWPWWSRRSTARPCRRRGTIVKL